MKKALLVAMLAGVTAVACAQDKAPAGAAKTPPRTPPKGELSVSDLP